MIDPSKIELCFMGFGNVICKRTDKEPLEDYYEAMVRKNWRYFNNEHWVIGEGVKEFVEQCHSCSVILYVLSWNVSNVSYSAEKKWLKNTFGKKRFEDNIIVGNFGYKVSTIEKIAAAYGIPASSVLVIDASSETLEEAKKKGFKTLHPDELKKMYEDNGAKTGSEDKE